jgi:hypothetical protein
MWHTWRVRWARVFDPDALPARVAGDDHAPVSVLAMVAPFVAAEIHEAGDDEELEALFKTVGTNVRQEVEARASAIVAAAVPKADFLWLPLYPELPDWDEFFRHDPALTMLRIPSRGYALPVYGLPTGKTTVVHLANSLLTKLGLEPVQTSFEDGLVLDLTRGPG